MSEIDDNVIFNTLYSANEKKRGPLSEKRGFSFEKGPQNF